MGAAGSGQGRGIAAVVHNYSGVCLCKRAIEAKLKLEPAFRPPAVFGVTCDCGRNVVLTVRA